MIKPALAPLDSVMIKGSICVMTHSFFSDVIRVACTVEQPEHFAAALSQNTPGTYSIAYSLECDMPCDIKNRVLNHLTPIECVKEFYEASPEQVIQLIKRETMRIPALDIH